MKYLNRNIDIELEKWAQSTNRKPLLLRGARQIGKTYAVRNLAKSFKYFAEIDLNERKDLHSIFAGALTPQQICDRISMALDIEIVPNDTLLFIDEIQECPDAINKLRYFYEKYPELHLIAAGSLLEFALQELPSFGVGRVQSIFMYPFSFKEFLNALGQDKLSRMIQESSPDNPLMDIAHNKALEFLRIFMAIGGMPEVIATYVDNQSIYECQKILNTIAISYRDDLKKYGKRINPDLLQSVWRAVAEQGQGKFVYSKVSPSLKADQIKPALETFIMAGLVYPVVHSAANGIPLGAEINRKYTRMIMYDTGIIQNVLGLNLVDFLASSNLEAINKGALAEVFVASELIKSSDCYTPNELYCWHREERNSNAEIDYVVQIKEDIIPIEVKSSKSGSMQSLRLFMDLKKSKYGIRTSLENFSKYENIKVYPIYAISNILLNCSN